MDKTVSNILKVALIIGIASLILSVSFHYRDVIAESWNQWIEQRKVRM